ncbi:hypothetical protein J2W42_000181 [Rhizobium tibeticum]|nr:hypothetical protein [Rhizobium tibeticum]
MLGWCLPNLTGCVERQAYGCRFDLATSRLGGLEVKLTLPAMPARLPGNGLEDSSAAPLHFYDAAVISARPN